MFAHGSHRLKASIFCESNFADTPKDGLYNTDAVRMVLQNICMFREDERTLQAFENLPFHRSIHSQRSLREHLYGVYALLCHWKMNHPVRLAGLFHSVYGTSSYSPTGLRPFGKDQLVKLIGSRAEVLVDLYCTIDRSKLLTLAAIAKTEPASVPSKDGSRPDHKRVSAAQFRSLLSILYADRVEQVGHRPVVTVEDWSRLHLTNESLVLWERSSRFLCNGARQHLSAVADR